MARFHFVLFLTEIDWRPNCIWPCPTQTHRWGSWGLNCQEWGLACLVWGAKIPNENITHEFQYTAGAQHQVLLWCTLCSFCLQVGVLGLGADVCHLHCYHEVRDSSLPFCGHKTPQCFIILCSETHNRTAAQPAPISWASELHSSLHTTWCWRSWSVLLFNSPPPALFLKASGKDTRI